jgi:hypothetical protein
MVNVFGESGFGLVFTMTVAGVVDDDEDALFFFVGLLLRNVMGGTGLGLEEEEEEEEDLVVDAGVICNRNCKKRMPDVTLVMGGNTGR